MNEGIKIFRKRGGRPKQAICRDQQLAVMCTHAERKIIEDKAKAASISNSEFLRTLGLKGQVDRKIKVLPREILLFTATLNHLAANINQVAKKRNSLDVVIPRKGAQDSTAKVYKIPWERCTRGPFQNRRKLYRRDKNGAHGFLSAFSLLKSVYF